MSTTAYWSPNQASIAQVETYTFTAPSGIGNTYTATLNGKSVTYASVSGDTAATVATALYNLLNIQTDIAAEFTEITFSNPSNGVVVATANVPGTPFANVNVGGVAGVGLVMSTGNGLANGIATAHTTPNASPSDVNDPLNWLRVTPPAPGVRQIPQNGDDEVVRDTDVPMLWNLDRLRTVSRNTFTRWQTFTGTIGLPETNPGGYAEWRATYYWLSGPSGSVPAGGLQMVLGQGTGDGPTRERYNTQSVPTTLTVLAAGQPEDDYGIRFLGVHTNNTFTLTGGASLGIATGPGEIASLNNSQMDGSASLGIGPGVTWTPGSGFTELTMLGGTAVLASAPGVLNLKNGSAATIIKDGLTWNEVDLQGGSTLTMLAGGTITTITLTTNSSLDKSGDLRALTITNHGIDGDTCFINDPLNTITYTNAGTVSQNVTQGPYRFTGQCSVKVVVI